MAHSRCTAKNNRLAEVADEVGCPYAGYKEKEQKKDTRGSNPSPQGESKQLQPDWRRLQQLGEACGLEAHSMNNRMVRRWSPSTAPRYGMPSPGEEQVKREEQTGGGQQMLPDAWLDTLGRMMTRWEDEGAWPGASRRVIYSMMSGYGP